MSFLERMFNVVRPAAKVKGFLPEFQLGKPIHQSDATHNSSFPPYAPTERPAPMTLPNVVRSGTILNQP